MVLFCTLQPLDLSITLEHLSNTIKFNGVEVQADIPSRIENGRFLFEMRSLAERTGAHIAVEGENELHKTKATSRGKRGDDMTLLTNKGLVANENIRLKEVRLVDEMVLRWEL